jgi:hypothetical protein
MKLLQVVEVLFGHFGRAATILTHVQLGAALLVLERQFDLMYLVQMRLKTATLCELAIALETLKRTHAGVSARVTFQIERVVEALLTKCAQVAFDVAMVLHVAVHKPLQLKRFRAYLALVFVLRIVENLHGGEQVRIVVQRLVLRIFHAKTAMY